METLVLELIKPLTLTKEDFPPINFEEGTVLKVLMKTPTGYLVTADSRFNFTNVVPLIRPLNSVL